MSSDPILEKIEAQLRDARLKNGVTPLMFACLGYDEAEFEKQLPTADVDATDKQGRTAIHEAVRHAHKNPEVALRLVRRLIESGADVNVQDKNDNFSPVIEAAIYDYPEILRLLIESGADVNLRAKGRKTAIGIIEGTPSLRNRRKKIVKILEAAGGVR